MSELNSKIITASKWSSITELASRLVAPISTIILARLLTPEAFGILVTATMVISFAEIFTDAGFQKYIVQHEFKSENDKYKSTTVAFWSNFILSIIIWLGIILFSENIATLVGNVGYGNVISISCICIPLAAFSSIQMALYKRDFDFKTLFKVRMVGVLIPLIITIPLAYITRSYWSLIIGMIAQNTSNALILTIKSKWKPNFYYSFSRFKEMFSFSIWSMIETLSIWFTGYIDIFFVGVILSQYYVGIYRTSMTTVGQIMGLITAATTPILFSALSRLQDNPIEFKNTYFKFQKIVGLLVIPIGVGIFIFRDFITTLLLGSQWKDAAYFIGLWGLSSSIMIVMSHFCSEIFRALGKPKLSVFIQISNIIFIIPTVLLSIQFGFDFLCEMRALVRLELAVAALITVYLLIKISPFDLIKNIFPSILASTIMYIGVFFLPENDSILINILYILLSICIYFGVVILFPKERNIILNLKRILKR